MEELMQDIKKVILLPKVLPVNKYSHPDTFNGNNGIIFSDDFKKTMINELVNQHLLNNT